MPFRARRRIGPVLALLLGVVLLGAGATGARGGYQLEIEGPDGELRPTQPRLAEDVFDPIFAFMMAVLDFDQFGAVDAAFLDSLVTEEGGTKLPYESMAGMSRTDIGHGVDARVRFDLSEAFEAPIPYSILGYNPGTVRATARMDLLHWVIGDRRFEFPDKDDDAPPKVVEVRDAHLFILAEGAMEFDVDGWLDRLLGGKLDDVQLSGFFIFRDGQRRIGLGFGYNPKGDGRTGAFDFLMNESIFPASKEYLSIGREMRTLAESRLEAWRAAQALGHGAAAPADAVPR